MPPPKATPTPSVLESGLVTSAGSTASVASSEHVHGRAERSHVYTTTAGTPPCAARSGWPTATAEPRTATVGLTMTYSSALLGVSGASAACSSHAVELLPFAEQL